MATIASSVQLQDNFSPVIQSMTNAMNICINSFEAMQSATEQSINTSSFEAARREINNAEIAMNQMESNIRNADSQQQNFNNSMQQGQNTADGLLGKIKSFIGVYAGVQGMKMMVGASDEMTQTAARLNIMNYGLDTASQLQQKIFESAQRSRASYTDTAAAIAKMGLNARSAFSSNDELIAFMEQINKQFVIGGASVDETKNAMVQLTQAMASGALRGEDLNSILAAAPEIARAIEKSMGWADGSIKQYAEKGLVTADVVKKAMFKTADETEQRFNSMPMTWSQVWTETMNGLLMASQPLLTAINWIANNLSIIGPIVAGVAGAIGVYLIATYGVAAATWVWTQAQAALNAVMDMNPIGLVIMAIVLLIGLFYAAVAAVNKFTGSTWSATGIIVGAFAVLGAYIYNRIAYIWNIISALVEFFANVFNHPIYSVERLFANLANNVLDWCISMTSGFDQFATNMANAIIKGINSAIGAWNKFVDILNEAGIADKLGLGKGTELNYTTSITSNLQDMKGQINNWLGQTPDDYWVAPKMEMKSLGGAFDWGYGKGANLMNSQSDNGQPYDYNDLLNNAAKTADGAAKTADNTGKTNDKLDITSEDLKYLRDIADRDTINRFTTAEVKVEMTNHNNVNSEVDFDGYIDNLGKAVSEGLNQVREGATYDM